MKVEIEKHSVKVALGELLTRHFCRGCDAGNFADSISSHFLDYECDQYIVIHNEDASKRQRIGRVFVPAYVVSLEPVGAQGFVPIETQSAPTKFLLATARVTPQFSGSSYRSRVPVKLKISAETVIAGTVAPLRHTRKPANEIAKTIIRDLGYFNFCIQPNSADKQSISGTEKPNGPGTEQTS